MDRNRKGVNDLLPKECEWVLTENVRTSHNQRCVTVNYHDQRGKNGSLLKMCERNITESLLKLNHDVGGIRV